MVHCTRELFKLGGRFAQWQYTGLQNDDCGFDSNLWLKQPLESSSPYCWPPFMKAHVLKWQKILLTACCQVVLTAYESPWLFWWWHIESPEDAWNCFKRVRPIFVLCHWSGNSFLLSVNKIKLAADKATYDITEYAESQWSHCSDSCRENDYPMTFSFNSEAVTHCQGLS